MLSQREIDILSYLSQRRNEFVKSSAIASMLEISDRTVRKYIKQLKPEVQKNGATPISNQGFGYFLKVDLVIEFEQCLKHSLSLDESIQEIVNGAKDRLYYIVNLLLFNKKCMTIEKLSNQLYISRSTLSQDISSIKKLIAHYN